MIKLPENWIDLKKTSLEELSPEQDENVLIVCDLGVKEAVFSCGRFNHPYYGQEVCSYFSEVTHWMPMPELPW